MSRSVSRTEVLPVAVCPTVRYETLPVLPELQVRSNQTARCDECMSPQTRREYSCCFLALCEQAFCFLVCFGLNMVVFLPQTLRLGTQTLFSFSKYSGECSTLIHECQAGRLLAWTRNQNIRQCGLLRKICKPLPVFGNCMGASLIRRLFDWLCKLWQGRSNPPTHHAPKGRPIHPPLQRRELSGPFTVKNAERSILWDLSVCKYANEMKLVQLHFTGA
jgi:hypothetical protein